MHHYISLRVGRFALEVSPGFYIRVPGIGAAHYCLTLGLTCDPWFGPRGVRRERQLGLDAVAARLRGA